MLEKAWFMKYEPKTINDLIFDSNEHKELVTRFINNEKIDGNIIFYGSAGLGKTATSNILINVIIKAQNDLLVAKERSVKEIREQILPFVQKKPIKSKQKIIYIEEFDNYHKDAINILKVGILEKYQNNNAFIACTNYINKIENAVLSRFNYKIGFTGNNIDGIIERMEIILNNENIKFNKDELINFINTNYKIGIRNLINILQTNALSNDNNIDFNNISKSSSIENNIVLIIKNIISQVLKMDIKNKKLSLDYPENSLISNDYRELILLIHNNTIDINYHYIYEQLYEEFNYIPLKVICAKYADSQEFKYFSHINLLSFYYDMLKCVIEMNRI